MQSQTPLLRKSRFALLFVLLLMVGLIVLATAIGFYIGASALSDIVSRIQ